jgi:hypothetical protein
MEYCREARRLRARLKDDQGAMHQALSGLKSDDVSVGAPSWADSVAGTFAVIVEKALDGPVLRYSKRLELLRRAKRMGIGRFEANLVIATVQHRRGIEFDITKPADSARNWPGLMAACLIVQSLIIGAIYFLLNL